MCIFSSILNCSYENQNNSTIKGSKCRSRELLKAIFCHQKNKKADRLCMKFSSTPDTTVRRCKYPLFQNQCSHLLLPHFFERITQDSGQAQQNGKGTYFWLPTLSFRINLTDTPSHICMDSLGVYLSRIFVDFLLKTVYPTMVVEKFQIYDVKFTGKCICESNNWIFSFSLMLPSKTLPQVLIITSWTGGNYEKMTKIEPARVLVTNFDKSHHLCTLHIFGFYLLCHNLDLCMLKCELN